MTVNIKYFVTLNHDSLHAFLALTDRQSGLFTLEETEDMNSIPSVYQHRGPMVALSRLVIFLAA
jgi:hypothetical protein